MTRAEYLNQLEQALTQLHPSARQEALDYFNEYFDEKGDDQTAIAELGNPQESAKEIIANLPEDALIAKEDHGASQSAKAFDFDFDFDFQFDWDGFFKHFKHSSFQSSERMELKAKIEELPEFSNLQISLEDQALRVQVYDGESVLLYNPVSEDGSYQAFDFQLVEDVLYVSSKPIPDHLNFSNNQASSAILKLPKKLLPLANLNLNTRDSSLTMVDVHSQVSVLQLEDSVLTLAGGQLRDLTLEASDTVINLTSLYLSHASIELEDCVWKLNEFALENSLNCKAEDTILTFKPTTDISIDITEENSILKLPKDMAFTMQKDNDVTHLSHKQENITAQLVIQCEDCQLTIN